MTSETNTQVTGYEDCMDQLTNLIKGRVPLIWVNTYEEKRFIADFNLKVCGSLNCELFVWSAINGLSTYAEAKAGQKSKDFADSFHPPKALDQILNYQVPTQHKSGSIFVMKDIHTAMNHPLPRQLRDMYDFLIRGEKTIVFVSPLIAHGPGGQKPGMEPSLDKQITVVDFDLPKRETIERELRNIMGRLAKKQSRPGSNRDVCTEYTDEEFVRLSCALQGLTQLEIDNAISTSIAHLKRLDEKHFLLEKKQVIKRSEILEYVGHASTMNDVGGLDEAKRYCDMYRDQFSPEAKEFGVEPIRGLVLTGIPGTGKSLLAKAVAAEWGLPLLRLDVGKVMTGLVGGSEEKMRMVIAQAEAIAPCVLWIDEIEKSLSGTKSSNFSDGGTLARVFGTLLTAMEERFEGVVTIATANDIEALPPELIRRFNEVFFVDLPAPSEREEIFNIHLRKRKRDAKELELDMEQLVNVSHRYTGSEIEKAVRESITRAFRDGKRALKTEDIVAALEDTKPIAVVLHEKIGPIREWARNRARYASSLAAELAGPGKQQVTTKSGKELKIEDALSDMKDVVKKNKRSEQPEEGDRFANLMDD